MSIFKTLKAAGSAAYKELKSDPTLNKSIAGSQKAIKSSLKKTANALDKGSLWLKTKAS